MKKLLPSLLALALLLSACGNPTEESPAPDPVPSDAPVYTRRYEDFTDTLVPAEDYGPLVPFAGAVLTEREGEPDRNLYGLMTLEGEVVVDPVFTSAFYLEECGDWNLITSYPNVILLGKMFSDSEGRAEERYALCAGDGSWCTDFLYTYGWEEYQYLSFAGGIPQMDREKRLVFLDPDTGEERRVLDLASRMDRDDYDISSFSVDPETGWVSVNLYRRSENGEYGNIPLLIDPQNELHTLPPEVRWVGTCGEGLVEAEISSDEGDLTSYRRGYLDVFTGEWAIEPIYLKTGGGFECGIASVGNEHGCYLVNTAGEIMADVGAHAFFHGGYWYVEGEMVEDILAVFDSELNPVDSPLVGSGHYIIYLEDGWVRGEVDYKEVLVRGDEVVRFPGLEELPYRLGTPKAVHGDRVLLTATLSSGDPEQADRTWVSVADLEGNLIARWEDYADADLTVDRLTGEGYLTAYPSEDTDAGYDLYSLDGTRLKERAENGSLWGGRIYTADDKFATLTDKAGKVIFRWPIQRLEPTPTPEPTPSGPAVYTDWSKLEPYEPVKAVYTRRYGDFTDTLIPSDDYGPLVPFAGAALTETWEGWSSDYNLYGLMTLEGEVVADPVFMSVLRLTEYDSEYNPVYRPDVMLLGKVFYDAEGQPEERYALCAGDGSWCTDFLYEYPWEMDMGISFSQGIPLLDREERLVFLDQDTGEELRALDLTAQAGGEDFSLSSFQVDPKTGWVLASLYRWEEESGGENLSLLFDPDGQAHPLPREVQWAYQYGDGLAPAAVEMDTGLTTEYRYGYVDALTGAWAIEPGFIQARTFENAVALVQEQSGAWRFIDPTGAPLTEPIEADTYWETGGYWYFISHTGRVLAVYDRMGKPVEGIQNLATGALTTYENGWVIAPAGEETLLAQGPLIYRFPAALGQVVSGICEEGVLFFTEAKGNVNQVTAVLADWDGKEVARWEGYRYVYLTRDELTGESYVTAVREEGERSYADHYDLSGALLASERGRLDGYYTFWNGMACWNGGEETTFTDREGNVLFRWPIHSAMD